MNGPAGVGQRRLPIPMRRAEHGAPAPLRAARVSRRAVDRSAGCGPSRSRRACAPDPARRAVRQDRQADADPELAADGAAREQRQRLGRALRRACASRARPRRRRRPARCALGVARSTSAQRQRCLGGAAEREVVLGAAAAAARRLRRAASPRAPAPRRAGRRGVRAASAQPVNLGVCRATSPRRRRARDDEASCLATAASTSPIVSGSSNAAGAGGVAVDVADPGRVARLDGVDRERGLEDRVGLDPRRLALVGGDAGVLEHLCGRRERRLRPRSCRGS